MRITATCLCGASRLTLGQPLEAAGICHCEDCRKCTGSAFNISVPFGVSEEFFVQGPTHSYTKSVDGGQELSRHFCSKCGSPLFTSSPKHPDRVFVKAGVLDDPSIVKPAYECWTQSSVPWSNIDVGLPRFLKSRTQ